MRQTVLTIITEIDPAKRKQLEGMLAVVSSDLYNNAYIPFASLSLLHFASFVIADREGKPSMLIFENNFDGDIYSYLDELLSVAGSGVNQIYQCCLAYRPAAYEAQELKDFLAANVVMPNAYFVGNVGRSAKNVGDNSELGQKTAVLFRPAVY